VDWVFMAQVGVCGGSFISLGQKGEYAKLDNVEQ
jgi:hypothetical protein